MSLLSLPARILTIPPPPQFCSRIKTKSRSSSSQLFRDSPIAVLYSIPAVLWRVGLRTGSPSSCYYEGPESMQQESCVPPTPFPHTFSRASGLLGRAHLILRQGGERLEVVEVQVLAIFLVEAPGGWVHGLHLGA